GRREERRFRDAESAPRGETGARAVGIERAVVDVRVVDDLVAYGIEQAPGGIPLIRCAGGMPLRERSDGGLVAIYVAARGQVVFRIRSERHVWTPESVCGVGSWSSPAASA